MQNNRKLKDVGLLVILFEQSMSSILFRKNENPGLFLYTKLGPVSGTKFFPNWLKKFSIDLEHSQLAEKSQFKRYTFPIFLKIALFFPKIVVYFHKITQFFPNIISTKNFPKRSEKALKPNVNWCIYICIGNFLIDVHFV